MKYSTKLSDAIHVLVMITLNPLENLTSTRIAESIHTNPAFVRQIMSALRKAGLITSISGHAKPAVSKSPSLITLYEIYKAIEGEKPLLHLDTHTNPECGVGVHIQLSLKEYYEEIQRTAEEKMKTITLQDIIDTFESRCRLEVPSHKDIL